MVFGVIDYLIALSGAILSSLIPLPELFSGPLISQIYFDYFFIGVFLLVILLSKFLTWKRFALALFGSLIISILVGGVHFTILMFILQIILIIIWKFFIFRKKKDDLGGDLDKEFGKDKGKEEDFGDIGKEGLELPKEDTMPDMGTGLEEADVFGEKKGQTPVSTCPYCNTPLRYIQQYKRYYCDSCKKYL